MLSSSDCSFGKYVPTKQILSNGLSLSVSISKESREISFLDALVVFKTVILLLLRERRVSRALLDRSWKFRQVI